MLGGGGNIQALLKNNRNLLRKKSFFRKDKSSSEKKKELLKNHSGELEFEKVSESKLTILKQKIRDDTRKSALKTSFYLVFLLLIIGSLLYINLQNTSKSEKEFELVSRKIAYEKELQERTAKYNGYIEDGKDQFEKQHWKNAIYFYKKALLVKPKDSLSSNQLKIATDNLTQHLNSQ